MNGNWAAIAVEINQVAPINTAPVISLPASAAWCRTVRSPSPGSTRFADQPTPRLAAGPVRADLHGHAGRARLAADHRRASSRSTARRQPAAGAANRGGHRRPLRRRLAEQQPGRQQARRLRARLQRRRQRAHRRDRGQHDDHRRPEPASRSRSTRADASSIAWQSYDTARLHLGHLRAQLRRRRQRAVGTEAHHHRRRRPDVGRGGDGREPATSSSPTSRRARTTAATAGHLRAHSKRDAVDDQHRVPRQHDDRRRPGRAGGSARRCSGFVVVWQSSGAGRQRRPASTASATHEPAREGRRRVPRSIHRPVGDQTRAGRGDDGDGSSRVAWQSKGQDGRRQRHLRRAATTAAGSALGNELLVNTTVAGDQTRPGGGGLAPTADFAIGLDQHAARTTPTARRASTRRASPPTAARAASNSGSIRTTARRAIGAVTSACSADGGVVAVWQSKNQDGNGMASTASASWRRARSRSVSATAWPTASMTLHRHAGATSIVALDRRCATRPHAGYWGPAQPDAGQRTTSAAGSGPALGDDQRAADPGAEDRRTRRRTRVPAASAATGRHADRLLERRRPTRSASPTSDADPAAGAGGAVGRPAAVAAGRRPRG